MARVGLTAALALGASALQIPLQVPQVHLDLPSLGDKLADLWDHTSENGKPLIDTSALQGKIDPENLKKRAEQLYEIAKRGEEEYNHPTRVIGSKGHSGTLEYILEELAKLGDYYTVRQQGFPAVSGSVFESRLVIGNEVPKSATPMSLTPSTHHKEPVYGDLILVKNSGCEASDFPETVSGNIAFIKRGSCAFGDKSKNAGKAGAVAAVIYDPDNEELHGTMGTPSDDHVATFGLGGTEGKNYAKQLSDGESLDSIAYIDAIVQKILTTNIIAQTKGGDQERCVMLGGHSDSVAEGPGINDDGSGSLSVLEVAVQLTHFDVNNCVRFAWWAGEEEGLLGSDYYVETLEPEEKKKIVLFMDYDMMGSPNYAYQVYNATNEVNPVGSGELKQLYVDWYEDHGLNYTFIPFDGRSDYDGFIRNGIPGGGIATGAEGVKTKEEVEQFGGKAGEWYDPCYHQLCDDVGNVNMTAWEVNTKLIAHSVATYARSLKGFPDRSETEVEAAEAAAEAYQPKYHGGKLFM